MDDTIRNSTVNAGLFLSAMLHGLSRPECRAAFEAETGERAYDPPRGGLEEMIDLQTGAGKARVEAFARWFARAQWGEEEAPDMEVLFRRPDGREPASGV